MKKTVGMIILGLGIAASANNINACMSCHGQTFEKKALGKSKIVKDMSEEDIRTALKGYKNGTYGGAMKGVMQGQVKKIKNVDMAAKHVYSVAHGIKFDKPMMKKEGEHTKKLSEKEFQSLKVDCIGNINTLSDCISSANNQGEMKKCKQEFKKRGAEVHKKHFKN